MKYLRIMLSLFNFLKKVFLFLKNYRFSYERHKAQLKMLRLTLKARFRDPEYVLAGYRILYKIIVFFVILIPGTYYGIAFVKFMYAHSLHTLFANPIFETTYFTKIPDVVYSKVPSNTSLSGGLIYPFDIPQRLFAVSKVSLYHYLDFRFHDWYPFVLYERLFKDEIFPYTFYFWLYFEGLEFLRYCGNIWAILLNVLILTRDILLFIDFILNPYDLYDWWIVFEPIFFDTNEYIVWGDADWSEPHWPLKFQVFFQHISISLPVIFSPRGFAGAMMSFKVNNFINEIYVVLYNYGNYGAFKGLDSYARFFLYLLFVPFFFIQYLLYTFLLSVYALFSEGLFLIFYDYLVVYTVKISIIYQDIAQAVHDFFSLSLLFDYTERALDEDAYEWLFTLSEPIALLSIFLGIIFVTFIFISFLAWSCYQLALFFNFFKYLGFFQLFNFSKALFARLEVKRARSQLYIEMIVYERIMSICYDVLFLYEDGKTRVYETSRDFREQFSYGHDKIGLEEQVLFFIHRRGYQINSVYFAALLTEIGAFIHAFIFGFIILSSAKLAYHSVAYDMLFFEHFRHSSQENIFLVYEHGNGVDKPYDKSWVDVALLMQAIYLPDLDFVPFLFDFLDELRNISVNQGGYAHEFYSSFFWWLGIIAFFFSLFYIDFTALRLVWQDAFLEDHIPYFFFAWTAFVISEISDTDRFFQIMYNDFFEWISMRSEAHVPGWDKNSEFEDMEAMDFNSRYFDAPRDLDWYGPFHRDLYRKLNVKDSLHNKTVWTAKKDGLQRFKVLVRHVDLLIGRNWPRERVIDPYMRSISNDFRNRIYDKYFIEKFVEKQPRTRHTGFVDYKDTLPRVFPSWVFIPNVPLTDERLAHMNMLHARRKDCELASAKMEFPNRWLRPKVGKELYEKAFDRQERRQRRWRLRVRAEERRKKIMEARIKRWREEPESNY